MKARRLSMDFSVRFDYNVVFTEDLFNPSNKLLVETLASFQGPARFLAVIDQNVASTNPQLLDKLTRYAAQYAGRLAMVTEPIVVPGGEQVKNTDRHVEHILGQIDEQHIDRHSYLIAIGGGAVIDMVGYAAAVAHRGIRLVRVPTTVLAQNDAAVGVKNGINAFGKKNFLGTFSPPFAVLNDSQLLRSLDQRDWIAGTSEAVKVALLKDVAFFKFIEKQAVAIANRAEDAMQFLVYRCAELHLEHIAGNNDPFEMGSSRPLDFGHWSAHKLEQLTSFKIRHGEAVAIGIALDCVYSNLLGLLSNESLERILETLRRLGFDIFNSHLDAIGTDGLPLIFEGLSEFREHLGGRLTIMLLNDIGHGLEVHDIDLNVMQEAIKALHDKVKLHSM